MRNPLLYSLAIVLICSCSTQNNTEYKADAQVVTAYTINSVNENGFAEKITWDGTGEMPENIKTLMSKQAMEGPLVARLGVEGMSCAKMCAGLIQKTLSTTEGIANCEVLFEEKTALVSYDPTKVTGQQMVSLVHGLHDGQYKVTAIEINQEADLTSEEHTEKLSS